MVYIHNLGIPFFGCYILLSDAVPWLVFRGDTKHGDSAFHAWVHQMLLVFHSNLGMW